MKIYNKLITELARLAKLNFDEKSSQEMKEDLNKIIGCVAIFFGVIIVQLLPIIKKTYDK